MFNLKKLWTPWKPYAYATLLVIGMTAVMHPIRLALDVVNIALLFLFPVLLSAVLWGLLRALYTATLGALAFDFFFVYPHLSFTVADLRYLISFGVYLAVAALTASLAARLKRQLLYSRQREAHTAALYEISRQMSDMTDIHSLLDNVSGQASRIIGTDIAVYLPDNHSHLVLTHRSSVPRERTRRKKQRRSWRSITVKPSDTELQHRAILQAIIIRCEPKTAYTVCWRSI